MVKSKLETTNKEINYNMFWNNHFNIDNLLNKKYTEVLVFVDESYIKKDTLLVCGLSIKKEVFNTILKEIKKEFGNITNLTEVHFSKKPNHIAYRLANKYINLISRKEFESKIYINLTIVDIKELKKRLGKKVTKEKMEKAFTRIAITFSINRFVRKYKHVKVSIVSIDRGGLTTNSFFAKEGISLIKAKSKAKLPKEISFIWSNPRKESSENAKYSIFIDITDIILGAARNCTLENKATSKHKREWTELIFNKILVKFLRKRRKVGSLNTYPKIRTLKKSKTKSLYGETMNKKRYIYKDDKELLLSLIHI